MPASYYYSPDPLLLPIALCMILGIVLQGILRMVFRRYEKTPSHCGMTGAQLAARMLEDAGVYDVAVGRSQGTALSDHYDPRNKALRLSQEVHDSTGVSALAVAAHEAGHAMQHALQYAPLNLRNAVLPVMQFASQFAWVLFLAGTFFSLTGLIYAGIVCFAITIVFQLITLPVEFNASSRALAALKAGGYLQSGELPGARKVLSAAAMTYVVAALMSILQLARFLGLARRRD